MYKGLKKIIVLMVVAIFFVVFLQNNKINLEEKKVMKVSELKDLVLKFWLSNKAKWYVKDDKFDDLIRTKFLKPYEYYKDAKLDVLTLDADSIIAFIILFDQLPRNMFRGTKEMYTTDAKALNLASYLIDNKLEKNLTVIEKKIIYMPLMHSEDLIVQKKSVELFKLLDDKPSLKYAIEHMHIIEKFNRFVHRNKILGRESTKEELEFLKQHSGF